MLKHALEKVRVIDLANYIAGTLCPTLLADLGADVIKLEAPSGDPFRSLGGAFQDWNKGKRSICVDLRTQEGREVLYRMVRGADVVVENYRPGVAQKLGADYETLKEVNPRIIYCSVSGYGQNGPYRKKPGFDPLLQARSGAMAFQGGDGNPPVFLVLAISDYAAAILGAYGVALGLYARARTGKGQRMETSLLRSCMSTQSGRFILTSVGADGVQPVDSTGEGPTYRLYATSDGWIFVGAKKEQDWPKLARALGREGLARDSRFDTEAKRLNASSELSATVQKVLATDTSSRWLERLEREAVPCSPVNQFKDLYDHPQVRRNGLVAEHLSPDLGPLKQRGVPVILSRTPGIARLPAPALGQHTDEVLGEVGYSAEEIARLRRDRIVN